MNANANFSDFSLNTVLMKLFQAKIEGNKSKKEIVTISFYDNEPYEIKD